MKRPSPLSTAALVVAILALVASMGGASYAAKMITGKDIKNGSITGKDIKKGSLTAKQVKKSSLTGTQLKDGSVGAADLQAGLLESTAHKVKTLRLTATSGANADAARAAAPETVLFQAGSLTVYSKCYTDTSGPTTYAETFIKTSQNGALFDSDNDEADGGAVADFLNTDTLEADRSVMSTSVGTNSADFYGNHSADFTGWGADGTAISGLTSVGAKNGTLPGGNGAWGAGDACLFTGNFFGS
jgi:hypothetical protein